MHACMEEEKTSSQDSFIDIWSSQVPPFLGDMDPTGYDVDDILLPCDGNPQSMNSPAIRTPPFCSNPQFSNYQNVIPTSMIFHNSLATSSSNPTSTAAPLRMNEGIDIPGMYGFAVSMGVPTESACKNAPYTFSHQLHRLFANLNKSCPVQFKCHQQPPPNSWIRATLHYKRPENRTVIVTRCLNHITPDANGTHTILVPPDKIAEDRIEYWSSSDGRESVAVKFELPPAGMEYTTIVYKFMCLSSCCRVGRRSLVLHFDLVDENHQLLGRRAFDIHISTCPGRDRSKAEGKSTSSLQQSTSKKRKSLTDVVISSVKRERPDDADDDADDDAVDVHTISFIASQTKYNLIKSIVESIVDYSG